MLDTPFDDNPPPKLNLDEPAEEPGAAEDATGVDAFVARLRKAIGDRPVDVVARRAGISREALRVLLRGGVRKRGMYPDTIEAIARVCGVRAAWLAFADGAP